MDNANSPEYLEKIKTQLIENLRMTAAAPSVQMTDVPRGPVYSAPNPDDPDAEGNVEDFDERETRLDDQDDDENKDTRMTERRWDQRIERDDELYDSDDEDQKRANGIKPQPGDNVIRRPRITDYENPNADHEPDVTSTTEPDQMALDSPSISNIPTAAAETTDANAAVSEALLAAKAVAPVQLPSQSTAATVASPALTDLPAPDPTEPTDVVMGETSAPPPPAAQIPGPTSAAPDATSPAAEKQAGAAERTAADDAGERKREADAPGGVV